jgi:DNA-binding response OmpR family regulator
MIRSHGGTIEAHSDAETGSRFTVRLPLVPASEATSFVRELDDPTAPHGAGQLVLVVDDEPDIRSIVRRALEANGFGVLVAANGEDAWRLIDLLDTPPDLLLSDVSMPDGDGIDLAERLIDAGSTVPIVLMSGLEDRATVSARVAQHARGFLVKPLSTPTLLMTVHEALTRTLTNGDHS